MKRTGLTVLIILLGILTLSGCSKLSGKWAYNHDPETAILELGSNGKAKYKGKNFQYQVREPFIELKSEDEDTTSLRYKMDGEKLYLYEQSVYDFQGNGTAERLPGLWKSGNSSFEFNSQGQFMEDGLFTGIYSIDPDAGTFTLKYNESFADTTCYYRIENNRMFLEYPWQMVKTK